jgi:hypothetical protein
MKLKKIITTLSFSLLGFALMATPVVADDRNDRGWSSWQKKTQNGDAHENRRNRAKQNTHQTREPRRHSESKREHKPHAKYDKHRGSKHEKRDHHGNRNANRGHKRDRHADQRKNPVKKYTKDHRNQHRKDHRTADRKHNRRDHKPTHSNTGQWERYDFSKHNKHRKHETRKHNKSRHQHKPAKKIIVVKNGHSHRPNHRLHKRHKYIYYRTPWYNTWYIAPVHRHYHKHGHRVRVLPKPHIRIVISGFPYFYYAGVFYKEASSGYIVVSAPIGAYVKTLPAGFIAFSLGAFTYYYVNDTYYQWNDARDGYLVVAKPEGADEAMLNATQGRLYVYPKHGQSEEQQAEDRYACHRWAVSESGVDPTTDEVEPTAQEGQDYKRAMAACLEGRGYSVR